MNQSFRNFLIWGVVFLLGLLVIFQGPFSSSKHDHAQKIAYSEFLQTIKDKTLTEITLSGAEVIGKKRDGQLVSSYVPERSLLISSALEKNIVVRAEPPSQEGPSFWYIFLSCLPVLLLIGFYVISMRHFQSGNNKAMGFGRSKARRMDPGSQKVTFADVAGIDEAKAELTEVVEFLKNPKKFEKLGGKIPKGVLLVGPPGTGKTLLAKAIAGEADVPYFSISGSDFVEMFVGVGASRVRDMFDQAKKSAPCIIFIDEIDAVGRHRGAGMGSGNDEREQTLNQMLVEMDGFEENQGIIIVAATNRPDILDQALLRPGRFDRQITVPNPDINGRKGILKVHVKKIVLAPDVDLDILARGTPGFSGADLANLCNEAALVAARSNKDKVEMTDFESAKDRVLMGAERRSLVMSDAEKKLTAYHEAGHAIVSLYTKESDPIHKVTIIPRGMALGVTMRLPENDRVSVSKAKLLTDIKVSMGGRIAEEMIFGKDFITTGASSDISMATDLAKRMIKQFAMSDSLGFQNYQEDQHNYQSISFAPATSQKIDEEIKSLLDECYKDAHGILTKRLEELHMLAKALLEKETLTATDLQEMFALDSNFHAKDANLKTTEAPKVKTKTRRLPSKKKLSETEQLLQSDNMTPIST